MINFGGYPAAIDIHDERTYKCLAEVKGAKIQFNADPICNVTTKELINTRESTVTVVGFVAAGIRKGVHHYKAVKVVMT